MKAVIIEDEKQAVNALMKDLQDYCTEVEVLGSASTVSMALELIQKVKPEIVFLDIQLRDSTGFELLEKIGTYDFKVIFTTAYSDYAIKAIKISALDYLLKPINSDELIEAVNKVNQNSIKNVQIQLKSLIQNEGLSSLRKKIAISTAKGISLHELETIVRLKSDGNYTSIYLSDGKKIMVAKILREFEELLDNLGFIRIHHSHIINLNHLESYMNKDGGYVILKDKTTLPVSKRKKSDLLSLLNNLHN